MRYLMFAGIGLTFLYSFVCIAQNTKQIPIQAMVRELRADLSGDSLCSNYVKPSLCISNGCCWTGDCVACR